MAKLCLVLGLMVGQALAFHTNSRNLSLPFDSGNRGLNPEVCWERCFQVEDTSNEQHLVFKKMLIRDESDLVC